MRRMPLALSRYDGKPTLVGSGVFENDGCDTRSIPKRLTHSVFAVGENVYSSPSL